MTTHIFSREFPLRSIQCGAALGNGRTGLLLWGGGRTLNMTLGCADLWDHRGHREWNERMNYRDLKAALETGEVQNVLKLLETPGVNLKFGASLIPLGRIVITLPEGCTLLRFEQIFTSGITTIFYSTPNGTEAALEFAADMSMQDVAACRNLSDGTSLELFSAYHLSLNYGANSLKEARGFAEPALFQVENGAAFTQPMPADPEYSVIFRRNAGEAVVAMARGPVEITTWQTGSAEEIFRSSHRWFTEYFADVPEVECGDDDLDEVYWQGMYKYGISTNPAGVSPGLQGPWIEDDSLPPWAGDYHFNINVQLCNSPGYKAGKYSHLRPLFDMVLGWKDKLRHNARCFLGIEDGYMLPHAVDDQGMTFGGFWCGTIDHGSTAWVAAMMFDYCDYTGDWDFLRSEVYDFMQGVLRVYRAMMERKDDGTLSLPVSVSPEFGEGAITSWGRNASFQLAAAHRVAANLLRAAEILNIQPDSTAAEIHEKLPEFCLEEEQIAVWEGQIHTRSHRHHSHLAAICPFATIDPQNEKYADAVRTAIVHWTARGMGEWTGWCVPWASQIHTRVGNPEMALMSLKIWKNLFTNDGGASLHDAHAAGFTYFAKIRKEIMQLDGAMGCVNAIQDLFVHQCGGTIRAFYGFPERAPQCRFEKLHLPGFIISGERNSRSASLEITATRDENLNIQLPGTPPFRKFLKAGSTIKLHGKYNGELLLAEP